MRQRFYYRNQPEIGIKRDRFFNIGYRYRNLIQIHTLVLVLQFICFELNQKSLPGFEKASLLSLFYQANFFASSVNLANPISVSGCLVKPRIDSRGQVQTLAPASAHFTMCNELRIEAASIWELIPWMAKIFAIC